MAAAPSNQYLPKPFGFMSLPASTMKMAYQELNFASFSQQARWSTHVQNLQVIGIHLPHHILEGLEYR